MWLMQQGCMSRVSPVKVWKVVGAYILRKAVSFVAVVFWLA